MIPQIDAKPKIGRRRGSKANVTPIEVTPTPRIKIVFGGRRAEDTAAGDDASTPSTSSIATTPAPPRPSFSWYEELPSLEELERRSSIALTDVTAAADCATDAVKVAVRHRSLVLMPYISVEDPDFVTFMDE